MPGIVFQGAFFAATPLMAEQGFDEAHLLAAIRDQLERFYRSELILEEGR